MKRIISAQEERKKQRRNQIIVSLILIVVMLFSTIGYAFRSTTSPSKKIKYNGFEFVYQNNYWTLDKDGTIFYFSSNPQELEEIRSYVKPLSNYVSKPLYLSPINSEANSEIYLNMNDFVTRIQLACLEGKNCEGNLPVKNCSSNFLIFEENNISEIVQDNNCVYIRGENRNLIKLTDIFLLKILGIY